MTCGLIASIGDYDLNISKTCITTGPVASGRGFMALAG